MPENRLSRTSAAYLPETAPKADKDFIRDLLECMDLRHPEQVQRFCDVLDRLNLKNLPMH